MKVPLSSQKCYGSSQHTSEPSLDVDQSKDIFSKGTDIDTFSRTFHKDTTNPSNGCLSSFLSRILNFRIRPSLSHTQKERSVYTDLMKVKHSHDENKKKIADLNARIRGLEEKILKRKEGYLSSYEDLRKHGLMSSSRVDLFEKLKEDKAWLPASQERSLSNLQRRSLGKSPDVFMNQANCALDRIHKKLITHMNQLEKWQKDGLLVGVESEQLKELKGKVDLFSNQLSRKE